MPAYRRTTKIYRRGRKAVGVRRAPYRAYSRRPVRRLLGRRPPFVRRMGVRRAAKPAWRTPSRYPRRKATYGYRRAVARRWA